MKSIVIGATQISQRKTISNLKEALIQICTSWNINEKQITAVITDNGLNIVGASKEAFGSDKHLPCFAHTLNLVVTKSIDFYNQNQELEEVIDSDGSEIEEFDLNNIIKKLKRIVAFFKRSESASTVLDAIQKDDNNVQQSKKLIQEVRTRWNSLYEMISRYLEMHELVSRALRKITTDKSSKTKPPKDLRVEEVTSLMEVQKLLKPFFLITQELCSEKHVTISKIIPMIMLLNKVSVNVY